MNHLSKGRKCLKCSSNPVIKTRSDTDEEIALLYGIVGRFLAVHAKHTHGAGIVRIETAQPLEGLDRGDARRHDETPQMFHCPCQSNPSSHIGKRSL